MEKSRSQERSVSSIFNINKKNAISIYSKISNFSLSCSLQCVCITIWFSKTRV